MEGHSAAQKMNLFYYRGCVNHDFKGSKKVTILELGSIVVRAILISVAVSDLVQKVL